MKKRFISLFLVLCMVLTLLPVPAFAEEPEVPKKILHEYVNDSKYYPRIRIEEVTENQEETQPEETQPEDGSIQAETVDAVTYLTAEEAGKKLRGYLKNRQTSFDLYVRYNGGNKHQQLAGEVLAVAAEHTGVSTEGDYLLYHFLNWGGTSESEYLPDYKQYGVHFKAEITYLTTAAQEREMTNAVNRLLNSLNVRNKSEYEKVKAVYDWVCQNVVYDENILNDPENLIPYTAYGALVNKKAVTQGYVTLLYRLLLELGLDCRVIVGELMTGDEHAWNIVKLGNVYYNLDATLDAQADPDVCFLRNSVLNNTHYRYLDYCTTQFHRDYPMSATDYVDGVPGEREQYFIMGVCGDDAYWGIDFDGALTIAGTGATYDYSGDGLERGSPWIYWRDGFDTVIVEEGITKLGEDLFLSDSESLPKNVASVTLPESLTAIGEGAFRNCDNMTQIRIPDHVTDIASSAFESCDRLETVILGKSVEHIGRYAFAHCKALKQIQFSDSLKTIETGAFSYCNSLTELTTPAGLTVVDGFRWCDNLQTLILSDSVETIANSAFAESKGLKHIQFPAGLKEIRDSAFYNCDSLTTVTISASEAIVGRASFALCDNLQTVYIGAKSIVTSAFMHCSKLHTVVISADVQTIGPEAFRYDTALTGIYFEGDAPQIGNAAFIGVTATAYYPGWNPTWTADVMQNYSGTITWVALQCQHEYDDHKDAICNICEQERVVKPGVVPIYRLYNPYTHEHLLTGGEQEKTALLAAGWSLDGIAWEAPESGDPVYRLYNPYDDWHTYTVDVNEMNAMVAAGWKVDGAISSSAPMENGRPIYRLFNPYVQTNFHLFTAGEEERDMLVEAGWILEGIAWYAIK